MPTNSRRTISRPLPTTPSAGLRPGLRTLLSILAVGALGLLGACGGSDESSDAPSTDEAAGADQGDAGTTGGDVPDPATVEACLEDSGYKMETDDELLSEEQLEDQLTMFGQTASLTFDAATNPFAGGVSFYETPELAAERAEKLGDVAKAQRVIGNALINIAAGSDFDEAVTAAETCLDA